MNAYTSSSSSSAMSVARVALGSSTTSPGSEGAPVSLEVPCSVVIVGLGEKVPAEQIRRVRTLHVRSRVDDHIPRPGRRRVSRGESRSRVGLAIPIGDDLVQGQRYVADLLAAADVYVRHMRRVGLEAGDLELDRYAVGRRDQRDRPRSYGLDPVELEAEGRWRRAWAGGGRARRGRGCSGGWGRAT